MTIGPISIEDLTPAQKARLFTAALLLVQLIASPDSSDQTPLEIPDLGFLEEEIAAHPRTAVSLSKSQNQF